MLRKVLSLNFNIDKTLSIIARSSLTSYFRLIHLQVENQKTSWKQETPLNPKAYFKYRRETPKNRTALFTPKLGKTALEEALRSLKL